MRYETREELSGKVDWEGGVTEAITGYGITVTDLPEDVPATIADAWLRIQNTQDDVWLIERWLESGKVEP